MPQAIVVEQYGGPEVLRMKDVKVGPPAANEVRLRHTRIGVNFHDVYVRSGLYKTLKLPGTPGIEAVGIVEACGAGVTRWKPGDRVAYVTASYGVYAEERLIEETQLLAIPEGLTDDAVASSLLRGLTVEMLVNRVHQVRSGSWALVQAAAGGVGQLLCQWLAHLGVHVIGTTGSDEQAAIAAGAGCSHVINYRTTNAADRIREITGGNGVAVAYDGVGKESFAGSLDSLDFCGHLVNFGQSSGAIPPFEVSRLAARSTTLSRPIIFHYARDASVREEMAKSVFRALDAGWLKVRAPRHFALADAAESHRAIEAHGAAAPLLLVPDSAAAGP